MEEITEKDRFGLAICMVDPEISVATRLRQFFRSVKAQDELAIQDELPLILSCLYFFLIHLLAGEPGWDDNRWFDNMIGAQYEWKTPGRFQVVGRLVWGLSSHPGGPQWTDPFFADVMISEGRKETAWYCLQFGRRDDLNKSELPFGFYPSSSNPSDAISDPWEGKADWKYEFRKDLDTKPSANLS